MKREKEPDDTKNLLEIHIRHRTEGMARFMRELKALVDRYSDTVNMLTIDAPRETVQVTPTVETSMEKKPTRFHLEKGTVYLIKDEYPERGFETFADVIRSQCYDCDKTGAFECEALECESCTIECPCSDCERHRPEGLAITRRYPKKVAQQYMIQTTPKIWLTQMQRDDVNCINPNDISRINSAIDSFVKNTSNGIILFEGLEYLITQNNFDMILKFIQHQQDLISASDSCILFLVDPLALEPEDIHILQRNMVGM